MPAERQDEPRERGLRDSGTLLEDRPDQALLTQGSNELPSLLPTAARRRLVQLVPSPFPLLRLAVGRVKADEFP